MTDRRRILAETVLSTAWFFLFLTVFTLTPLPNQRPITRPMILVLLPELLSQTQVSLVHLPQRAGLLFVALAIAAGAWGLGSLLLRCVRVPVPRGSLERFVFSLGLGLSALSLLTLLSGLAGCLWRGWLGGVLVASFAGEIFCVWRERGSQVDTRATDPTLKHGIWTSETLISGVLIVPFLVLILLGACLPSTDFDSMLITSSARANITRRAESAFCRITSTPASPSARRC